MKIGIFGGSFNPPHKMHFYIAKKLIGKHYVDKVIFVPTGSQYKYKNNLVDDFVRYRMVELMITNDKRMEVSDYELKDEVVYTYETLAYFRSLYPGDEIYFICGADNFSYIDKWKNGEKILSSYKIIVIERDTDNVDVLMGKYGDYRNNIIVADMNQSFVSSTYLRKCISNGDNVGDFLNEEVLDFIKMNHLYVE